MENSKITVVSFQGEIEYIYCESMNDLQGVTSWILRTPMKT